jgi:hypothetical protein
MAGTDPKSSGNPTQTVPSWRQHLMLAWSSPKCGAKTRRGHPCRSPAMPNGRCRMHGGASPGAPKGPCNGMWRHGLRSAAAIERRRRKAAEMRSLRQAIRELAQLVR